jgi:hypothetical protein
MHITKSTAMLAENRWRLRLATVLRRLRKPSDSHALFAWMPAMVLPCFRQIDK